MHHIRYKKAFLALKGRPLSSTDSVSCCCCSPRSFVLHLFKPGTLLQPAVLDNPIQPSSAPQALHYQTRITSFGWPLFPPFKTPLEQSLPNLSTHLDISERPHESYHTYDHDREARIGRFSARRDVGIAHQGGKFASPAECPLIIRSRFSRPLGWQHMKITWSALFA